MSIKTQELISELCHVVCAKTNMVTVGKPLKRDMVQFPIMSYCYYKTAQYSTVIYSAMMSV